MADLVCEKCGSKCIDERFFSTFKVAVCDSCKKSDQDQYALITKTAAMREFLLTAEELEDTQIFPHLVRPNPHKSSWHNMQLFLRKQVADFSVKKHGSLNKLEDNKVKKVERKLSSKEKRYSKKMKELRQKTRLDTSIGTRSRPARHTHDFEENDNGKLCRVCGFQINYEK